MPSSHSRGIKHMPNISQLFPARPLAVTPALVRLGMLLGMNKRSFVQYHASECSADQMYCPGQKMFPENTGKYSKPLPPPAQPHSAHGTIHIISIVYQTCSTARYRLHVLDDRYTITKHIPYISSTFLIVVSARKYGYATSFEVKKTCSSSTPPPGP